MKKLTPFECEYGLERTDTEILRYLRKHPLTTPSTIARELKIPRTSVHFRLSKFATRGWCEKKKVRNLSKWSLTQRGLSLLVKSKTIISEMSFSEGSESFDETFLSLAGQQHPCRVYIFEPSEQTRLFTKNTQEASYAHVSDLIKKNDIIVEALIGERTVEHVQTMSEEVRKHMYGRPTIAYELSDEILNFDQVIICFIEDVFFFNYSTLVMTHIRSKEITENYRKTFEFYRSFGKKIDFNKELYNDTN